MKNKAANSPITFEEIVIIWLISSLLWFLGTLPNRFSSMEASLIFESMSTSLHTIHLGFMSLKMGLWDLQHASKFSKTQTWHSINRCVHG